MKNSIIFVIFLIAIILSGCGNTSSIGTTKYIQHTVMFNLKHDSNSVEEKQFLEDGKRILSTIPGVKDFEVKKQVSFKNGFKFYFTMFFKDGEAYEAYNTHPEHVKFVNDRWETEVAEFLEADFINYP